MAKDKLQRLWIVFRVIGIKSELSFHFFYLSLVPGFISCYYSRSMMNMKFDTTGRSKLFKLSLPSISFFQKFQPKLTVCLDGVNGSRVGSLHFVTDFP